MSLGPAPDCLHTPHPSGHGAPFPADLPCGGSCDPHRGLGTRWAQCKCYPGEQRAGTCRPAQTQPRLCEQVLFPPRKPSTTGPSRLQITWSPTPAPSPNPLPADQLESLMSKWPSLAPSAHPQRFPGNRNESVCLIPLPEELKYQGLKHD